MKTQRNKKVGCRKTSDQPVIYRCGEQDNAEVVRIAVDVVGGVKVRVRDNVSDIH